MRWHVASLPTADASLAEIWLAWPDDRQAITAAANRIDVELRTDPQTKGDDFYGDRIFQYGPLAVVYEVVPEDRLIRIISFSRIKD